MGRKKKGECADEEARVRERPAGDPSPPALSAERGRSMAT
jgi:hypothetical protein